MAIDRTDSQIISLLRVPLAIMVVFCHLNPQTTSLSHIETFRLSTVFDIIGTACSYVFAHTAVPCFFLLSGFLFFEGLQTYDTDIYLKKLKKRSISLVIPYLAWNTLSILSFIIYYFITDYLADTNYTTTLDYLSSISLHSLWDCNVWGSQKINWLGNPVPSTGPTAVTLWFLRDLIVVTVLAPLFWWLFKTTKKIGLYLLLVCFVSHIWISVPGFSIDATFFFGVGAYLSIHDLSLIVIAKRFRSLIIGLSIITFPFCLYYGGLRETAGYLIFPFWSIGFVGTLILLAGSIVEKKHWKIPSSLLHSCMFVYALHALPLANIGSIISYVGTNTARLIGTFPGSEIISYFITPFLTVGICLLCFYVIRALSPMTCMILTGKKYQKEY